LEGVRGRVTSGSPTILKLVERQLGSGTLILTYRVDRDAAA
jgi:hypothetical protein